MREIITRSQFPYDDARKKVNNLLHSIFSTKQRELEERMEETCEVSSPIRIMNQDDGVGSTHYFETPFGTVVYVIADDPQDDLIEYKDGYIFQLVNKPVETTNEQPAIKITKHEFNMIQLALKEKYESFLSADKSVSNIMLKLINIVDQKS